MRRRLSRKTRNPLVVSVVTACIIAAVCVAYSVFLGASGMHRRFTIAVAATPTMIVSFDTVEQTAAIISIPESVVIEAAHGYGQYSLQSLWKLGIMDHTGGTVFADSASNTFGIPIDAYVGPNAGPVPEVTENLPGYVRSLFSLRGIRRAVTGSVQTNLSFPRMLALARLMSRMKSDAVRISDIKEKNLVSVRELPDGSAQNVADTERIDAAYRHVFEDSAIRKEALSVVVFNSTKVPVLASRAARMLTNIGTLVIALENSDTEFDRCGMTGSKDALTSETAAFIRNAFHCSSTQTETPQKADLYVTIGKEFAKRFVAKSD